MMSLSSSALVLNFWSMVVGIYRLGDQSGCLLLLIAVDFPIPVVRPAHFAAVLEIALVAVEARHLEGLQAKCC
jgi:hypothetical protein